MAFFLFFVMLIPVFSCLIHDLVEGEMFESCRGLLVGDCRSETVPLARPAIFPMNGRAFARAEIPTKYLDFW